MNVENKLYAIAKRVTLEAGFPYTDPRTGETTQPKPKSNKKTKKGKNDSRKISVRS